jgi:hypothetical protein
VDDAGETAVKLVKRSSAGGHRSLSSTLGAPTGGPRPRATRAHLEWHERQDTCATSAPY